MKKSRFAETQIVSILKEADAGIKVNDLCRQHGISAATYYKWKSKYGGMEASQLKQMKELESELSQYKRMYAELAHENYALRDVIEKVVKPVERREVVKYLRAEHKMSVTKACKTAKLSRAGYYRPRIDWQQRDEEVITEIDSIIQEHSRWGFWMCYDHLRFKGHHWNHKRVYRVYCNMGLNLKRRGKKRLPNRERVPLEVAHQPNEMWALDFMHDTLYNGRRFRTLNVLDEGVRECLAIEIDTSLPAERVVRVLNQLKQWRDLPQQIRIDNGPEFISHTLKEWAEQHEVKLAFIQPGKPTQNAFIERFNKTYREEVLNAHLFHNIEQVREITWWWMMGYNEERPHKATNRIPPTHYRIQLEEQLKQQNQPQENSTLQLST